MIALVAAAVLGVAHAGTGGCVPRTVTYTSAWTGMTSERHASRTFIARDGDYSGGDRALAGLAVRRVLRAIASPPPNRGYHIIGIGPSQLLPYEHSATRDFIGRRRDIQGDTAHAFAALYTSPAAIASFLDVVPVTVTDDYPSESLMIQCRDGKRVELSSTNTGPLMVPWRIVANGSTRESYSAEIPRSVYALLGDLDVNGNRLSDEGLAHLYADSVAQAYRSHHGEPDPLDLMPEFRDRLRRAGFVPQWSYLDYTGATVKVRTVVPGLPHAELSLVVDADDTPESADVAISSLDDALSALRRYPWFWSVLSSSGTKVRFSFEPAAFGAADTMRRLNDIGRTGASSRLSHEGFRAIRVEVSPCKTGETDCDTRDSEWYLFSDGTLMLGEFNRGMLMPFALDELALTPHDDGRMASGAIFEPDGSWSLP